MPIVTATKLTDPQLMRLAASYTNGPGKSFPKFSLYDAYKWGHSPMRTQIFFIEMMNIPTYVSVHLVRHTVGTTHFVQSNRNKEDRVIDRNTPVNHAILINAEALINISRKRLCFKSDKRTIALWNRVRHAIKRVDPDLAQVMMPECHYRNGYCPEPNPCFYVKERGWTTSLPPYKLESWPQDMLVEPTVTVDHFDAMYGPHPFGF